MDKNEPVFLKGILISEPDLTPIIFYPKTIQSTCNAYIAWCLYDKQFLVKDNQPLMNFKITDDFVSVIKALVYEKIYYKYKSIQNGEDFHNGFEELDDAERLKLKIEAANAPGYLQENSLYRFLCNFGVNMEHLPRTTCD